MRFAALVAIHCAPVAVMACAANPIPVLGSRTDLSALAGEWEGTYSSEESGRSGSIHFELMAGSDTAFGEVIMVPEMTGEPRPDAREIRPEPLTIWWVGVADGHVSGRLAPYHDPVCGCTLETRFDGELTDNTIEGVFSSRHLESGVVQHGEWKVRRVGQRRRGSRTDRLTDDRRACPAGACSIVPDVSS